MMARPKYSPQTDSNSHVITDFLKDITHYGGLPLDWADLSRYGGRMLDGCLCLGPLPIFCEIKTPEAYAKKNHDMTAGEKEFFDTWPSPKAFIVDEADIAEILRNWYPVAIGLQEIIERKANERRR